MKQRHFSVMVLALILALTSATVVAAQDWNSSPNNWDNNPNNWENSQYNWKNSPYNWDNSPNKWGNDRIIYDNEGNASGYAVPKKDGGVNIYDFKGKRKEYTPPRD